MHLHRRYPLHAEGISKLFLHKDSAGQARSRKIQSAFETKYERLFAIKDYFVCNYASLNLRGS
jgi:hypothetical protein